MKIPYLRAVIYREMGNAIRSLGKVEKAARQLQDSVTAAQAEHSVNWLVDARKRFSPAETRKLYR